MQKPFSVALRDFRNSIVDCVNTSGLPFDAMLPTIKELVEVVAMKAEEAYKADLKAYEEALKAESEACEDNEEVLKEYQEVPEEEEE